MELNSSSIHVGEATFSGDGSNLNDPSVTIIVIRLPYLTSRAVRILMDVLKYVVIALVTGIHKE